MKSESELLASRYGKTAPDAKKTRQRIIALAAVLLTGFLGWAIWVAASGASEIKHQVLGYEVLSENQTSVKFSVQSRAMPWLATKKLRYRHRANSKPS